MCLFTTSTGNYAFGNDFQVDESVYTVTTIIVYPPAVGYCELDRENTAIGYNYYMLSKKHTIENTLLIKL